MIETKFPFDYTHSRFAYYSLNSGGTWVLDSQTVAKLGIWEDSVRRSSRPTWRDEIQRGTDAGNAYFRSGSTLTLTAASGKTRRYDGILTKGSIYLVPTLPSLTPEDSIARDIAVKRVKRKIASLTESYQALIPLAELREARSLIRQMADYTIDMVKAVADLKRTKGKSLFRFVQDRWLIYSFGVSPMISDLNSLGHSIWAFLTKGDVRSRVRGTGGRDWLTPFSGGNITGFEGAQAIYTGLARHEISYRYTAGWKFLIRSSNDYRALDHFGLTVPALVPALWETTAFSWVADYFSTAGEWLSDVFVGDAGSSMYVVESRRYKCDIDFWVRYKMFPDYTELENRPGVGHITHWEFIRTPLAALPPRTLRFKTLDEIGLHSVTKLLNLVSLIGRGKYWQPRS